MAYTVSVRVDNKVKQFKCSKPSPEEARAYIASMFKDGEVVAVEDRVRKGRTSKLIDGKRTKDIERLGKQKANDGESQQRSEPAQEDQGGDVERPEPRAVENG